MSEAACLVFDSSPLIHFAKTGRLAVLERLGQGRRCVVPQAVLEEIAIGVDRHPALGSLWLVFEGYNHGLVDRTGTEDLIAGLLDSGAWYPCGPQDAFEWAKSQGLLR